MTSERQSDRGFALMFAAVFSLLAGVVWLATGTMPVWAAVVAFLFLVAATLFPWLLMPLNRLWGRFAVRLGRISNHLLLGLFFFLFICPAGAAMRLFGRDTMARKPDPGAASYLTPVGRDADAETLGDLF